MNTVLDYRSWQWNGKKESPRGINRRQKRNESEAESQPERESYAKQLHRQWELVNGGMCTFPEFLKLQGFTVEKIERLNNEIIKQGV